MFKAKLLCIGWSNKRLDNVKMHGTSVKTSLNENYVVPFICLRAI